MQRRQWSLAIKGLTHHVELTLSGWPRRHLEVSVDGHIQVNARIKWRDPATYPVKIGAITRYVRIEFFGAQVAEVHFHLLDSAKGFVYAYDDPVFAWRLHWRFLGISLFMAGISILAIVGDLWEPGKEPILGFGFLLLVSLYKILSATLLLVRANREGRAYRELVEQTEGREWLGGWRSKR